jgi:hypothetical protein
LSANCQLKGSGGSIEAKIYKTGYSEPMPPIEIVKEEVPSPTDVIVIGQPAEEPTATEQIKETITDVKEKIVDTTQKITQPATSFWYKIKSWFSNLWSKIFK